MAEGVAAVVNHIEQAEASFMSNLSGAGFAELQISNRNTDYTVNLFESEAGDLFVERVEVFTVLTHEAIAE